jgi:GDP/UDP-N,N'-diacetylbacillosamine 2-epimerase (hydrolysing)
MKKICVITGTRAEYGLLQSLIRGILRDPGLELQLVVTGMHLSPEFGLTWKEIEADGIPITRKTEILLSSDTAVGVSKSTGLAQISFAETFDQLKPDLIVLLGDRTEIFAAAAAALIACIPVAHISGGEITQGAYDDAIRHSITKMSHLHFTSTETYRRRVIRMGEHPDTVFNTGALAIDNIKSMKMLTRDEFEASIGRKLLSKNLLITFHPVTLDTQPAGEQFSQLLLAVDELENTLLIFTRPNSDKDGRIISQMIDEYTATHPGRSIAFSSLGHLRYLSAISLVDAVVGNSSSGIIEVPALNKPTVNIGDRQKGRIMGPSIFNCPPNRDAIGICLELAFAYDPSGHREHPYGDGTAAEKILSVIKSTDTNNLIIKHFHDE